MVSESGGVIYVGKAKDLKKRVSSYFLNTAGHDLKTIVLVSQIANFETIVTRTESEALILENQLIKQYMPRYNILLKDDKGYPYIRISINEPFPKLTVVRKRYKDHALYFGPFPSIGSTKVLQKLLIESFQIRDCKQEISLTEKEPKCILLDIGKCLGPCIKKEIKPIYDHRIDDLKKVLAGKSDVLLRQLSDQMKEAAEKQLFEKAGVLRDQIARIKQFSDRQIVELDPKLNAMVVGSFLSDTHGYVLVQEIIEGKLIYQHGKYQENSAGISLDKVVNQALLEVLGSHPQPKLTLILDDCFQESAKALQHHANQAITVIHPKKGNKYQLIQTANTNAKLALSRVLKENNDVTPKTDALDALKQHCFLKKKPVYILGFDISHLQGTQIVASSVSFYNGYPFKQGYKRYQIKSVSQTSNDPESMYEVVYRRLSKIVKNKETLPDLLLIDGGIAQRNFATQALFDLELQEKVDLISLAKRDEEIFTRFSDTSIRLSKRDPALQLLQRVRDESHRFALTYQRHKRHKASKKSQLETIKGLGPKRINALYKQFKTIEKMKKATIEDLKKIVPESIAMMIVNLP